MRISEIQLRNICRNLILEFSSPLQEMEVLMHVQDFTDSGQSKYQCTEEAILRLFGQKAIAMLEEHPDISKHGNPDTGFWYESNL